MHAGLQWIFLVDLKSEIRISAYLSQHRPYYGIVTSQQLGMTVWSKPNFASVGYRVALPEYVF